MNHYRIGPPPRWWEPRLSPRFVRLTAGLRRKATRKLHCVVRMHVHNEAVVQNAIKAGKGVMITPNHSSHCDPHAIYDAADIVGTPLFIMATWHVFDFRKKLGQWMLQKIGCFSVDRDGADMKAFKEAIRIMQQEPHPLVIFPEGEVYHCNEKATPFLEGPAVIASTAARKCDREMVIIPCAMKYDYVSDPTPELLKVMTRLERSISWRPRVHKELKDRIYDFSQAALALKEIEFFGEATHGTIPERVHKLSDAILAVHEKTRGIDIGEKPIPERVKEIRRRSVKDILNEDDPLSDADRKKTFAQLDDAFLVGQLYSYPGNYVAEKPSVDRIAETIDKFEEDGLQLPTAAIRGQRECHVYFGEPIPISGDRKTRTPPAEVTRQMEQSVQAMLDGHKMADRGF